MVRALPFRTRILAIVMAGGLIPLLVVGLWLTGTASRSGEALLRRRLESALDRAVLDVGARWIRERAALVSYSEDSALWRSVGPTPGPLPKNVLKVSVRDSSGERAVVTAIDSALRPTLPVTLPVFAPGASQAMGTVAIELRTDAVLGGLPAAGATVGALMAAFDRSTGSSLLALPFDPLLLERDRFQWGGDEWIASRRVLEEPPVTLIATAPLTPFAKPFEDAARAGTLGLALVALASLGLAALLTARLTRRLRRLAGAADAIALGDLEQKLDLGPPDEVGRAVRAFNTMTESLRRTLAELAQRQSLAAVGEFASALAHEIRNPLTAVRLDLQRVEETLEPGSPVRDTQRRALREVDRLDGTVNDALRIARSGRITRSPIDLLDVLRAAMNAAAPEFAARGAVLDPLPALPARIPVHGDAAALEQVFLNLLLNAAQALEPGGHASIEIGGEAGVVMVTLRDQGRGIPAEQVDKVFDLFFTTRSGGTGLGLSIARQIVLAHGGKIELASQPGVGTTASITLPASSGSRSPG